jgi:KDO2-lipid IV(A) lauroyltransferase
VADPSPPFFQRLQFLAETLGFDAGSGLIRALGPDRASAMMGALWRRAAPLNKRHARARANIAAHLPDLPEGEIDRLLDRMWDNLGRTLAESFHIAALVGERERFTIDAGTMDAIARAKAGGAVFVSLHQGNWELASPLLHVQGLPVAGVYQRIRNPLIDERASAARAPFYALGLHAKGAETARRLLRIIGDRGTVTIMADLRDLSGIMVPFFGDGAPSTVFPALLARGRNVPLFAGSVQRVNGATFRITTREIPVPRTANRDDDIRAATASIQAVFEEFIRAEPSQWMWGHRRWRR